MNRRAASAIAFLIAIVFILVSVELLFRLYLFGWDAFSIQKVNSVHEIGVSGLIQASPYPEIVYELKPDLKTYFKLVRFETNSAGLRDVEYPVEKPGNTVRVAVVGDSVTMPSGVALEDAYHTVLEKMFNRNSSGKSYEFLNFGVGGYGLRQYLGVIENKALAYSPDLILIGFCALNDHDAEPDVLFQDTFRPLSSTRPFFRSFSLQAIDRLFHRSARRPVGDQERQYMRTTFARIRKVSAEARVPVVVAYLSNLPEDDAAVRLLVEESGLDYVDVSAMFRGTKLAQMTIYPADSHPNAAANRMFAERIHEFLRRKRLL